MLACHFCSQRYPSCDHLKLRFCTGTARLYSYFWHWYGASAQGGSFATWIYSVTGRLFAAVARVIVQAALHLLIATGLSEKLVAHQAPEHLLQLFFPSPYLLETGLGLWSSCKLDSPAAQEPSVGSSRVLLTPIASSCVFTAASTRFVCCDN